MSTLYTPVFFPPPPKQILSSQPSQPSPHIPGLSFSTSEPGASQRPAKPARDKQILKLSSTHVALSRLQPELCPPSPPRTTISLPRPSAGTETRSELICRQVQAVIEQAGGNCSNGKWGQIPRLLTLSCTQGRWSYQEALRSERARAGTEGFVAPPLILPATEEEWAELELEHNAKLEQARQNAAQLGKDQPLGSKRDMAEVLLGNGRPPEHAILARVREWQQELPTADAILPSPPISSPPVLSQKLTSVENFEGPSASQPRSKSRSKARPANLPAKKHAPPARSTSKKPRPATVQVREKAQLGFPVVKRSSVTSVGSKPSQERKEKGKEKEHSQPKEAAIQERREEAVDVPGGEAVAAENIVDIPPARRTPQIHDVSEMSFLPPSFPPNMQTSTPKPRGSSRKPDPIPNVEPPASSPLSSPPRTQDYDGMPPPQQSPVRPTKRARESILDTSISVPANVFRDIEPGIFIPHAKKARLEDEPETVRQGTLKHIPPPTSNASRKSGSPAPPVKPAHIDEPVMPEDAQAQPRPGTPKQRGRALPTLTELLASSKQTPSSATKSAKPAARPFSFLPAKEPPAADAPALAAHESASVVPRPVAQEPPRTPDPSPAKSMFSFASASTASPGQYAPFRSPSSPSLSLTQHPSQFVPQAMSSQPSLQAGSSGLIAGGGFYNSQFDVNEASGRASALLEKDVNFDMWLRSEEEEELDELEENEVANTT
ncbi:hypothetical protein HWV62_13134 [Athelia sp. TMB]|nr:hypothetical protein HWV62_13134 [Athelia sp. TMB]